MPKATKAGPSNQWVELEPGYEPSQQAEEVPEVTETVSNLEPIVPDPQPRKRTQQVIKPFVIVVP